jgi:hypothetical protein
MFFNKVGLFSIWYYNQDSTSFETILLQDSFTKRPPGSLHNSAALCLLPLHEYFLPGVGVAIAIAFVPVGVTPLGVIMEGVA